MLLRRNDESFPPCREKNNTNIAVVRQVEISSSGFYFYYILVVNYNFNYNLFYDIFAFLNSYVNNSSNFQSFSKRFC